MFYEIFCEMFGLASLLGTHCLSYKNCRKNIFLSIQQLAFLLLPHKQRRSEVPRESVKA